MVGKLLLMALIFCCGYNYAAPLPIPYQTAGDTLKAAEFCHMVINEPQQRQSIVDTYAFDFGEQAANEWEWKVRISCLTQMIAQNPDNLTLKKYLSELQREQTVRSLLADNMVLIPPGEFELGCGSERYDQQCGSYQYPQRRLNIDYYFAIAKYEVTNGEFLQYVSENNIRLAKHVLQELHDKPRYPYRFATGPDAEGYARWLSTKQKLRFRLPSEAEWQYAVSGPASASATVSFRVGVEFGYELQRVGRFKPNYWGLYDMVGSVNEIVKDCWHSSFEGAPRNGKPWLYRCENRRSRSYVVRGGEAGMPEEALTEHLRNAIEIGTVMFYGGFRLVQQLE